MIPGHSTGCRRHGGAGPLQRHPELQESHLPPGQTRDILCPSGLQLGVQGPVCDNDPDLAHSPVFASRSAHALTLCHPFGSGCRIPLTAAGAGAGSDGEAPPAFTGRVWYRGRTASPGHPPRAAWLSWAPCGTYLPRTCGDTAVTEGGRLLSPWWSCPGRGSAVLQPHWRRRQEVKVK